MRRKWKEGLLRRLFACAVLIALGGSGRLSLWIEDAAADEASPSSVVEDRLEQVSDDGVRIFRPRVRHLRQRKHEEAAAAGETGDAKHFAARLKHHQGRRFAKRKREFRTQQLRLESQRRAIRQKRARIRAREFAAARRHAAQHAPKHHRRHIKPKVHGKYHFLRRLHRKQD